jgi:hypothetical protein
MTDEELQEAMLDPYEEDPEAAEGDALEYELAWKLNLLMTDLVGELWGRVTLYVVPVGSESSWARTLLRTSLRRCASPSKVRGALNNKEAPDSGPTAFGFLVHTPGLLGQLPPEHNEKPLRPAPSRTQRPLFRLPL